MQRKVLVLLLFCFFVFVEFEPLLDNSAIRVEFETPINIKKLIINKFFIVYGIDSLSYERIT